MAPIYAGILGLLAFSTFLARGMIHAADGQTTLLGAWCCLIGFAALGYLIGAIAERTVEESVRATIQAELNAADTAD